MVSSAPAPPAWHLIAAAKTGSGPFRPLSNREPDQRKMKHATSIALHSYWQSRHDASGVPAGGIRAAELAAILPSLFLIDVTAPTGACFRYCGEAIPMRYGRDMTDESFLALWNVDDRETLQRELGKMAVHSTGLVAGVTGETVGGGFSAFEMLLLPLAAASGMGGAIGSMARIGGHAETNRIRARLVSQSLCSIRFVSAAPNPVVPVDPTVEPGPRHPLSAVLRRHRHLTVINGGVDGKPRAGRALTDL
jgi:hypothetical protein